jgi:integrase
MKMARRKTLTDVGVAALKARSKRYVFPDPEQRGHYVRVHPSGKKSYCVVVRDPHAKQVWTAISDTTELSLDAAREKAREIIGAVKSGKKDVKDDATSFGAVAENWFRREVLAKGFISHVRIRHYLDQLLLPAWGDRDFVTVRRVDVANLLDDVADTRGPAAADSVLSTIRSLCNWYSTRDEGYISPIARKMRRQSTKEQARSRILNDDELRQVWAAAEADDTQFGAFVRLALLTGQRRSKVVGMKWDDLDNGFWTVPKEKREKNTAGRLKLSALALEIIDAQPRLDDNPLHVFCGKGGVALSGISQRKAEFDAKVGPIAPWVVHDLRRTARSLLSRCPGVARDVAERVLGHAVGNSIEATYDRHSYEDEKGAALAALAGLIDRVVHPPRNNVRKLRG